MEVRIGRAIYSTDNNCFFMPTEVASIAVKKLRKRGYRVKIERMSKYTVKVIAIGPEIDRLFVKEMGITEVKGAEGLTFHGTYDECKDLAEELCKLAHESGNYLSNRLSDFAFNLMIAYEERGK